MRLNEKALLLSIGLSIIIGLVLRAILERAGIAGVLTGELFDLRALALPLLVTMVVYVGIGALYGAFAHWDGMPLHVDQYAYGGAVTGVLWPAFAAMIAVIETALRLPFLVLQPDSMILEVLGLMMSMVFGAALGGVGGGLYAFGQINRRRERA